MVVEFAEGYAIRDAPVNSNDIVITRKTVEKYRKTVDDLQYRVYFIVI